MSVELTRLSSRGWKIPPSRDGGIFTLDSTTESFVSYPTAGFHALGANGGRGYWFDHRARAVARVLTRFEVSHMWEIGAGTGSMTSRLSPPLQEIVTVEPSMTGARALASLGFPVFCSTLSELHLPADSISCVGAFDVIEHLQNPAELLNEIHRVLVPNGLVVVTVPALEILWGGEDDIAGHFVRYNRRSLDKLFIRANFAPVHAEYLFACLVLPAMLTRAIPYRLGRRESEAVVLSRIQSQLEMSGVLERIARSVLKVELAVAQRVSLPLGASLVGLYRRQPT